MTIETLLKNKLQYAKDATWRVVATNPTSKKLCLRVTQNSPFEHGGTGNGQSEIRKFLEQNGTFYVREETTPKYIYRLEMQLK